MDKIAIWDFVKNVQLFTVSPNHVLVVKPSLDPQSYVEQSFPNAIMFVKERWIVDTNVKKCAIMENVNVSKKLLLNADVGNKKSKLFVEGKLYV